MFKVMIFFIFIEIKLLFYRYKERVRRNLNESFSTLNAYKYIINNILSVIYLDGFQTSPSLLLFFLLQRGEA